MKLLTVAVFSLLLSGVLAALSSIALQTANYNSVSTKGGLYASITILILMIFGEFGYLPYRFKGKRKRFATPDERINFPSFLSDRNTVLQIIRSVDHRDCLLRYLCELEALRVYAEKTSTALDPDLEPDLILLKVARRTLHPALLMRKDPASPALPFEVAVFTGSEGLDSCANTFHLCPYNITTMKAFLSDDSSVALL